MKTTKLGPFGENSKGQLGLGDTIERSKPILVDSMNSVSKISCCFESTLFLHTNGTVFGAGCNKEGQIGLQRCPSTSHPQQLEIQNDIIDIASGREHSLFLDSDGRVYACGNNQKCQIGDNYNANERKVVKVEGLPEARISSVYCGSENSVFIDEYKSMWMTGRIGYYPMHKIPVPSKVSNVQNVSTVSSGGYHTIVKESLGRIMVCGYNDTGQLGLGTRISCSDFVMLPEYLHDIIAESRSSDSLRKSARK